MQPKAARATGTIVRVNEDVIGKSVLNQAGESIGDIKEVVVDAPAGRVTYAVLSFGGFLGMGDKLFAVPWGSLTYDRGRDAYTMKADKELLKNAPGFDKNNWPDMSDPTHLSSIYAYYKSEPYWQR